MMPWLLGLEVMRFPAPREASVSYLRAHGLSCEVEVLMETLECGGTASGRGDGSNISSLLSLLSSSA